MWKQDMLWSQKYSVYLHSDWFDFAHNQTNCELFKDLTFLTGFQAVVVTGD